MNGKIFSDDEVTVGTFADEDVTVTPNVPSADNLIEGAKPTRISNFMDVNPAETILNASVGGLVPAVAGARDIEDSLPLVVGGIGEGAGTLVGHPHIGAGIGTASGDLMKQTVKKLQGEGDDISIEDALILGGSAAAGSFAFEKALKTVGLSTQLIPERARAKMFDKALQAVNIGKKQLSRNWESAVTKLVAADPEKRVNLRPAMAKLADQVAGMDETLIPQLKTAVKNNPNLKRFVNMFDEGLDPDKAIGVTLKEANELKNAVTSATNTILKKAVKGKTLPSERVVLDVIDKFDDAITEAYPQMAQVRRAYKEGRQAFELARPLVEPGKSVEEAIFSKPQGMFGLGGTQFFGSTQGRLAAKDIMRQTAAGSKLFEALKAAHNINRAVDTVGRLGEIAVGGAIIRKVTGRE